MENKTATYIKQGVFFIIFTMIAAVGDSCNFQAAVGVAPLEATEQTINFLTNIKIGTLTWGVNFAFIALQFIISRKIKIQFLLQIPMVFILGLIENYMLYTFFANLELTYPMRIVFMVMGLTISAIGVGLLMSLNLVVFPLEGFCQEFCTRFNISFTKIRQGFDIVAVVLCVAVSLIMNIGFGVREGTVVAALIYGPIMGFVMKKAKPIINKQLGRDAQVDNAASVA